MPCRIISEMVYSSLIVFSWVFTASWGHLTSAEWWCCHSSSHGNQTGTEGTEGSSRSSEQGEWRQGQQGTGVLPPSHPWNRWLCQQRDLGAPGSSAQWPRTGLGVGAAPPASGPALSLVSRRQEMCAASLGDEWSSSCAPLHPDSEPLSFQHHIHYQLQEEVLESRTATRRMPWSENSGTTRMLNHLPPTRLLLPKLPHVSVCCRTPSALPCLTSPPQTSPSF